MNGKHAKRPDCVTEILNAFVSDNDRFKQWMEETQWEFDSKASTKQLTVYNSYKNWCDSSGIHPYSGTAFNKMLATYTRGAIVRVKEGANVVLKGIKLSAPGNLK